MSAKLIAHVDPSICSLNVGDEIISCSVSQELSRLFPSSQLVKIPSQDSMFVGSYRVLKYASLSVVGGTNLLNGNMPFYRQWKVSPFDIFMKNEFVLLGVGWWQYQRNINFYSRYMYRAMLSRSFIHSVRDEYTKSMLESIGISNVINTGCPTMWMLTPDHCRLIPKDKSPDVVFTLTDYLTDEELDIKLIKVLLKAYNRLFFWPQGHKDLDYLNMLLGYPELGEAKARVEVLSPNVVSLSDALVSGTVDFVGTRLHAGIKALQNKVRTLIIGIDNRAIEKAKDFNLPVIERKDLSSLTSVLESSFDTKIRLRELEIESWRKQFEQI